MPLTRRESVITGLSVQDKQDVNQRIVDMVTQFITSSDHTPRDVRTICRRWNLRAQKRTFFFWRLRRLSETGYPREDNAGRYFKDYSIRLLGFTMIRSCRHANASAPRHCSQCQWCGRCYRFQPVCTRCHRCQSTVGGQQCCICICCSSCSNIVTSGQIRECCGNCQACCRCVRCTRCERRYRDTSNICAECGFCTYAGCCNCGRIIMDYSTRAPGILGFKGDPDNKRFFGIELEVEADSERNVLPLAKKVLKELGKDFVILKHDGSLYNGFEIVTAPATMEIHKEKWKPFWASKDHKGLTSWKSGHCGLHIHVSRNSLSQLSIGKILVFVNNPVHSAFVRKIAGRGNNEYARSYPKKIADGRRIGGDRREAVNNTNRETIEFRIFRGTLYEPSFWKALEFVHAVCAWVPRASSKKALVFSEFSDWVGQRNEAYPNLNQFLTTEVNENINV